MGKQCYAALDESGRGVGNGVLWGWMKVDTLQLLAQTLIFVLAEKVHILLQDVPSFQKLRL